MKQSLTTRFLIISYGQNQVVDLVAINTGLLQAE